MTEADVLRMVISLAFIVLLILVGAWLMRRAGWLRAGAGQEIKVLGSRSLGARSSVAVVQVDDTRLVVGVTPQQITLLHRLPVNEAEPTEVSEATLAAEPNFGASLREVLARARRRDSSSALHS